MLMYQPAGWRATESSGETLGTIGSFDFNAERSQDVNTPRCPGTAILRPFCHGSGDVTVDQPVTTFDLSYDGEVYLAHAIRSRSHAFSIGKAKSAKCSLWTGQKNNTYIVIIPTRSNSIDDESPDFFNAGKGRFESHGAIGRG